MICHAWKNIFISHRMTIRKYTELFCANLDTEEKYLEITSYEDVVEIIKPMKTKFIVIRVTSDSPRI